MKKKIPYHLLLRLLSLAVLPMTAFCDVLLKGALSASDACFDVWWAVLVVLLYPTSAERVAPSFAFIAVAFAAVLAIKLLGVPILQAVSAGAALVLGFAVRKSLVRYSEVPTLFHVSSVWRGVEDYMYLLNMGVCLWAGFTIPLHETAPQWVVWSWAALLGALYLAQYYRVYSRSTLFLRHSTEDLIRKTQHGPAFKQPIQYVDSDSRSAVLFNEVVRIMEIRKPWLQVDFGIEDLARLTRSNRMYLSKSVNFHSGRNFNQLVNSYRIRYATELIRKDPSLKMMQVSKMCGFRTVVSFNMAFKLHERMTPTEYVQSLKKIQ
ncbi:MAG: helix-turn-helix domain-containing protein [Bacteroidales bacterium]|nr:helix-turn-helix domain-containing protein [Bacteroidales bacterium]